MSWLWEQPLPIFSMGALLFLMLSGGLLKTGQRWLWGALLTVFFLTSSLLVLEYIVVTPHEQIERTLGQIAEDLESNQKHRIIQAISASATELKREAELALKRLEFHQINVKPNLETTFFRDMQVAVARFNAMVDASERAGVLHNQRTAWFFIVQFTKKMANGKS